MMECCETCPVMQKHYCFMQDNCAKVQRRKEQKARNALAAYDIDTQKKGKCQMWDYGLGFAQQIRDNDEGPSPFMTEQEQRELERQEREEEEG